MTGSSSVTRHSRTVPSTPPAASIVPSGVKDRSFTPFRSGKSSKMRNSTQSEVRHNDPFASGLLPGPSPPNPPAMTAPSGEKTANHGAVSPPELSLRRSSPLETRHRLTGCVPPGAGPAVSNAFPSEEKDTLVTPRGCPLASAAATLCESIFTIASVCKSST